MSLNFSLEEQVIFWEDGFHRIGRCTVSFNWLIKSKDFHMRRVDMFLIPVPLTIMLYFQSLNLNEVYLWFEKNE